MMTIAERAEGAVFFHDLLPFAEESADLSGDHLRFQLGLVEVVFALLFRFFFAGQVEKIDIHGAGDEGIRRAVRSPARMEGFRVAVVEGGAGER